MADERIERSRRQQRVDSYIDDLPPLNDHLPDETPPVFEWKPHEPTQEERAEFFATHGVRMAYNPKV